MDIKTQITELPLIEEYESLITASQSSNLILFIGAGVSRIIGSPSWEDLSRKYLDFILKNGLINYSEYKHLVRQNSRKLISICNTILDSDKKKRVFNLQDVLENNLPPFPPEYSDIYHHLDNFNCPFVTTNFDKFLDSDLILREADTKGDVSKPGFAKKTIYYHYSDLQDPELLKPHDVVHIHGSIHDPKKRSLVLTIKEYFRAYSRTKIGKVTDLPEFLSRLFKNKVILFIGYGLEEYEVLEYIVDNIKERSDIRHYMLSPFMKEESNIIPLQSAYYSQLGINLIPYSISEIGYYQLYYVIKEWSKVIGKNSKQRKFLDDLAMIDSVL